MKKNKIKSALKITALTMGISTIVTILALKTMLNKASKAVSGLGKMAWASDEDAEAEVYDEVSAMVMTKDNRAKVSV